jgi:CheY-like chemotaxis protein
MPAPRVLLIDDNALNRRLFRRLLVFDGMEVLEAENAESGIEVARLHRPDLILMDIQLPGMDGLEATRVIRSDAEIASIPVVALTSFAMGGDEARCIAAGCRGYISKPVEIGAFTAAVRRYVEASRSGSPGGQAVGNGGFGPGTSVPPF